MNAAKLYIPAKLKIGFVKREDTYQGTLAYVIYYDDKGVLRKEKSWQSWRDHKLKPEEVKNTPTEGFVLNKKVGGYKSHWNYRDAHVRVYDPRGFEFEISVPNLLFILTQCDCSRGKGLEGQFVYAWEGTELVLLPVSCDEYVKSKAFTGLQGQAVSAKDLVAGATYTTKNQADLVYLGRFDYYYLPSPYRGPAKSKKIKRHVFWDPLPHEHTSSKVPRGFVYFDDLKRIARQKSDHVSDELAKLTQKYHRSEHGTKVVRLFLKEADPKDQWERNLWSYEKDGWFYDCRTDGGFVRLSGAFRFEGGILQHEYFSSTVYPLGRDSRWPSWDSRDTHSGHGQQWVEPTSNRLYAELESGATVRLNYGTFSKDGHG